MKVQLLESSVYDNTVYIVDDNTGEVIYEESSLDSAKQYCADNRHTVMNITTNNISERGSIDVAIFVVLMLAILGAAIYLILSGNTTVLDLYNWLGQTAQALD